MFHNKRPLIFLLVTVLGSVLVTQQSMGMFATPVSASESSHYESGRDHGCEDAGLNPSDRYINEPGKGPSFHTQEFMAGYNAGFNECGEDGDGDGDGGNFGPPGGRGGEIQPQPDFDQPREIQPQQGGIDWIKTCNDLQTALVSSCDVLVNPDNTLTTEGERAVNCIRNGIALAGGSTLLLSLPLPLVIAALQVLEEPTGCGGIVARGLIGNTDDLRGLISRLT